MLMLSLRPGVPNLLWMFQVQVRISIKHLAAKFDEKMRGGFFISLPLSRMTFLIIVVHSLLGHLSGTSAWITVCFELHRIRDVTDTIWNIITGTGSLWMIQLSKIKVLATPPYNAFQQAVQISY